MTEPNTSWAEPEGTPPAMGVPTAPVVTSSPTPVATPKKKGGGLTNVLLVVAAIIAVGGVAFAVGRATAPAATSGFGSRGTGVTGGTGTTGQAGVPRGSFDPAAGFPGGGPGLGGFGAAGDRSITLSGTVKSIDGTAMTLTTASGTVMTIDIAGSTYHSQAPATAADVKAGATVAVSVTGFGGGRGGPNASAAPGAGGVPGAGTITATDVTIAAK